MCIQGEFYYTAIHIFEFCHFAQKKENSEVDPYPDLDQRQNENLDSGNPLELLFLP